VGGCAHLRSGRGGHGRDVGTLAFWNIVVAIIDALAAAGSGLADY
jgi:hypothetical protein